MAVAAIEITIDMSKTRKVPTNAFLALEKIVLMANESEIAVFIHIMRTIIIGAGLMDTISRRNAADIRRNIAIEQVALSRKST